MWKYLQGLFSKESQSQDWTPDEIQRDKDPAAVAEVMTVQDGFVGKVAGRRRGPGSPASCRVRREGLRAAGRAPGR